MQSQPLARFLQDLSGFDLLRRQMRDDASVHKAVQGFDEVWIPFRIHPSIIIGPLLEVEDRCADVRLFALARLALAVEIPDGLGQCLCDIGTFPLQRVPDMVGGDDVRLSAFKGSGNAEESNDV